MLGQKEYKKYSRLCGTQRYKLCSVHQITRNKIFGVLYYSVLYTQYNH